MVVYLVAVGRYRHYQLDLMLPKIDKEKLKFSQNTIPVSKFCKFT